jgi:hypothetical protein
MEGFLRPEMIVLPESAVVPSTNRIVPPPNRFTHELVRELEFHYRPGESSQRADGTLPVGTRVVLIRQDTAHRGWVADEAGLYVEVDLEGLRSLT